MPAALDAAAAAACCLLLLLLLLPLGAALAWLKKASLSYLTWFSAACLCECECLLGTANAAIESDTLH